MSDVACLGIFVADLIGRPIDALPPHGRLGLVRDMRLHIGGCAANTGIDLARLGVATSVLGKVGADGLGDYIAATLAAAGVDTRGVVRDPAVSTSASMVLVDSEGERTFLHHLGGNAAYRMEDVSWELVGESRILHVAGALVMPGLDGEPMAHVLRRARAEGKVTSLDTVWDATGSWMRTLAPCLAHVDYFLPSLAEGIELTGYSTPQDVAKALQGAGVRTVGLKLGPGGCYLRTPEAELHVAGFCVEAADGTGAGDAWDAGFLTGLAHGWDLERTARFANAVGALCVTAVGATAGVRGMEETLRFMQ